jgi:hypothetical protein
MIIKEEYQSDIRKFRKDDIKADFVVIGGGISGICAAITAARMGTKTVLIQDRPVLGGNASSEVRLWILGATSHMGNNNRWAREGGVIDEILVENFYRNPEGNPLILDSILLEKVRLEVNIKLLLNTAVIDLTLSSERHIDKVVAFCSQNSTMYEISAPLFCDASGDGVIGFKSGASFRMGAESKDEFGELFAPDEAYGELLGHSMYFYSKRVGRPVKYIPPAFALKDIKQIPRYKIIDKDDSGCRFWWLEYGGRSDTVHDTEDIKWELWKVIYGVWDYIKNSGEFEDVDDLTLEWVGTIPGKRESRRFEGLYMLKQQDLVEQRQFEDAVAFGGWAMDLHPSDGLYSALPGCMQWHTLGIYQIPYRCFVSKDIDNLFFAGRIISATHVAFGSSRVMATGAHGAQAVGMAAAICTQQSKKPVDVLEPNLLRLLQNHLNCAGQSIPGVPLQQDINLAVQSTISGSSELILSEIRHDGTWFELKTGVAQLLPLQKGVNYTFDLLILSEEATLLEIELRISSKRGNYTPDVILEKVIKRLNPGEQLIDVKFETYIPEDQYAFLTILPNEKVKIAQSSSRYTGLLSVYNGKNKAVSNFGKQEPPHGIGIDSFEFWIPYRRPEGKNLAMKIHPPLRNFSVKNVVNGYVRPYLQANAWLADPNDNFPNISFSWPKSQRIKEVKIFLDNDYDHPMESVLMGHPENEIPFCVKNIRIKSGNMVIAEVLNNHQTIITINFTNLDTKELNIGFEQSDRNVPAAVFQIVLK